MSHLFVSLTKPKWIQEKKSQFFKKCERNFNWFNEKSDTDDFKSATKSVSRCLETLQNVNSIGKKNFVKNKYWLIRAWLKMGAPEVRYALFGYFVDTRSSLKDAYFN